MLILSSHSEDVSASRYKPSYQGATIIGSCIRSINRYDLSNLGPVRHTVACNLVRVGNGRGRPRELDRCRVDDGDIEF